MKWFERFKFALVLCSIGSRCVIDKMKAWDKKMWRCKGDQESAHLCFARMLTSCHLFFQVSQNGSWYLCNTTMHCAVTVAEYLGNFWWESWSGSIKMMLRIPETCWLSLVLPFASCSIDIHFTVYAAFALAFIPQAGQRAPDDVPGEVHGDQWYSSEWNQRIAQWRINYRSQIHTLVQAFRMPMKLGANESLRVTHASPLVQWWLDCNQVLQTNRSGCRSLFEALL